MDDEKGNTGRNDLNMFMKKKVYQYTCGQVWNVAVSNLILYFCKYLHYLFYSSVFLNCDHKHFTGFLKVLQPIKQVWYWLKEVKV